MSRNPTVMPDRGQVIDTAAVSLGLPGFVVLAAADYGGELELLVETTQGVTGCPDCGVVATLHDRKPRWVRDLPAGGRPVRLVWFKREGQTGRARVPEPRQLPPTGPPQRRRRLEHRHLASCPRHPDPRPLTTLRGVEPL